MHAFAFDGANRREKTVVTTLVNWDTQASRNTTVSLRCHRRLAIFLLAPATDGAKGGRSVEWEGIAINGVAAHVTNDGEIPPTLLEPTYTECDHSGRARVTLGALTAAFAVTNDGGGGD
eukprot:COSAG02_NODE_1301_length_13367_cov_14.080570_5_plen_119_part_00